MTLLSDERALYVDEIGHLDQYGSYVDSFWEKGVAYFVRDYYAREVEVQLDRGVPLVEVRPLIDRLAALNSDIQKWEHDNHAGRVGGSS